MSDALVRRLATAVVAQAVRDRRAGRFDGCDLPGVEPWCGMAHLDWRAVAVHLSSPTQPLRRNDVACLAPPLDSLAEAAVQ